MEAAEAAVEAAEAVEAAAEAVTATVEAEVGEDSHLFPHWVVGDFRFLHG